jgi:peptide/nickel transport system ATP-binding protein/oligopeptide transport system ATP-binding protein
MYFGKLVELAPTATLFSAPRHPYTEALLGTLDDELRKEERPERGFVVSEDLAGPGAAAGCRYYGRCPIRREACATVHPPLEALDTERLVACYERGSSPPAARITRS